MGTYLRICLILAVAVAAAEHDYRLPQSVIPTEYDLEIITNLGDVDDKFEFEGTVKIHVTCKSPTDKITLHSKDLVISSDNVTVTSEGTQVDTDKVESDENPNDFLVIHLKESLEEGKNYIVEIPFAGILKEGLAGYYKSHYVDKEGKQVWLAVTQFEPSDARRAFPCFDEPAMKAKFTISLGRTKNYTSLSNMPIDKTEDIADKPDWEWDRYKQSVLMSTYLVGYAVSDFIHQTSPPADNNVTFNIWCRKDAEDQIEFAKDIGPKFLSYFEKYFDIPYPLPKQDMIALPDFAAGAMENWGFITYRETYLLYDPKASSVLSKLGVASVVAHELAHQWFGNLVTMKWWTDLWLNEGFATYMSTLAVEHVFPEWKSLIEDTVDNIVSVFSFDSLQSSHPVSVPIGHPKEINEIFDTISYKKGSYLLHTMSNFLGAKTLQVGVSNYLKDHSYGNAEKDDLWKSITEEAHKTETLPANLTVKTIMDTWALQTGYPLINVKRNYGKGTIDIEQERFFKDSHVKDTECSSWWVPLTYTTKSESNFNDTKVRTWLPPNRDIMTVEGFPNDEDWIIFNIEASGLYRVNYDDTNWKLLSAALKAPEFEKISILNRVLLIDNAANLASIGRVTYAIFFDIIKYLEKETEYLPWKIALRAVDTLDSLLKRTKHSELFENYIRTIVTPIYEKIGGFEKISDGNVDEIQHKVIISSAGCRYEAGGCPEKAKELFAELKKQNSIESEAVPNELRGVVYCTAMKAGDKDDWDFLYNMYTVSNVATIKNTILKALACSRKTDILENYLTLAVENTTSIRKQDVATVFQSIIVNDVGFKIAKDYIANNLDALHERLKPTVNKLSSIINTLGSRVVTSDEYDWLVKLIESNDGPFEEIKNGAKQAIETAKMNMQWNALHFKNFEKYLPKEKSAEDDDDDS